MEFSFQPCRDTFSTFIFTLVFKRLQTNFHLDIIKSRFCVLADCNLFQKAQWLSRSFFCHLKGNHLDLYIQKCFYEYFEFGIVKTLKNLNESIQSTDSSGIVHSKIVIICCCWDPAELQNILFSSYLAEEGHTGLE